MKTFKKIIFWSLVVFALIQFVPTDKVNRPVARSVNFIDVHQTPSQVSTLLKNACYDCHSDETVYPKYAYIAPLSWSVKSHINEGRKHLNFSVWNTYNKDLKESMVKKTIQTVQNRSMPVPAYIVYHEEANLSEAERALLADYFQKLEDSEK